MRICFHKLFLREQRRKILKKRMPQKVINQTAKIKIFAILGENKTVSDIEIYLHPKLFTNKKKSEHNH